MFILLLLHIPSSDKKSKLKPPKSPFLSPRFGRKKSSSSLKSPPPSVEELNACLRSTPPPVTLTPTPGDKPAPRQTPTPRQAPTSELEKDGNRRPNQNKKSQANSTTSPAADGSGISPPPVVTPTFGRRTSKDSR